MVWVVPALVIVALLAMLAFDAAVRRRGRRRLAKMIERYGDTPSGWMLDDPVDELLAEMTWEWPRSEWRISDSLAPVAIPAAFGPND